MDNHILLQTLVHSHSKSKEWTENLLTKIRVVRATRGSKRADEINKLELEIMGRLYEAEHDTTLTEHINALYSGWIKKLIDHYPQLTKEEQILCCYLRMNLSIREVSVLLGIQANSVKMSYSKLKEKLNLPNNTDILTFINTQ